MIASQNPAIRVLIVAPSLTMIGGQSVQADLLLQRLTSEPIVKMSFQPINPALTGWLGAMQRVRYLRTLINLPLYICQLVKSISRCDVVHVFSASYLSFVISQTPAIIVARLFRKPVLLNYHSGEAEDHLHKWPSAVRTLHRVNSIVVPSAFLVRVFGRFGLRASAIANMVDVRAFEFQSRDAARPRFLVNRNFEAHYNVACVLRAFALIQKQLPDAVLTVAGDGPQRADLQRLAEDLDLRNTRFVGRVRPDAMPLLYQEHDIWLNASNVDNMPLSILECFSSGVVAVSTSAGGIPDMVDHGRTGLLVPCNDSIALAAAALNVVNTPTFFSQLKRNALQECEKYTWTAVRAQWLEAYRELAAKSGDRIP